MKAGIIGDGAWGTALALVLNRNGHDVTVWSAFPEHVADVKETGENRPFLPDVPLPAELEWTDSEQETCREAELLVFAVPTRYARDVLTRFSGLPDPDTTVVSVAKGFDPTTGRRMSELVAEQLRLPCVAALSGPSHAEEVARELPTAVTAAARNGVVSARIQTAFMNPAFRVYTCEDIIGVELGGALKNVIAVAVGVSDGLGFGDNTRAALITRGLVEITRLGCALGADRATFAGLSGLGDLIVTCASRLSRNRAIGERIGRGESVENVVGKTTLAAEGVWNCAMARDLARKRAVDVPITDEVYAMIHEGKSPVDSVRSLMEREGRPE